MDHFVEKEVFVIVAEEDTTTGLYFYDDIEETFEYLATIDPLEDPETKVFHGVLTKAESIPSEINVKSCYVISIGIIFDSNRAEGVLYQSECEGDTSVLAGDIEETITASFYDHNSLVVPEIENIYVLYGYELATGLCINRESIDEEIVHTCKTIAAEAKETSKKYANN
jgi:hypothetical protein